MAKGRKFKKSCYLNTEILTVVLYREYGRSKIMDRWGTFALMKEDQVIVNLIEEYGTAQWTTIATQMRELVPRARTSKQIR